jgi:hypothetical protein
LLQINTAMDGLIAATHRMKATVNRPATPATSPATTTPASRTATAATATPTAPPPKTNSRARPDHPRRRRSTAVRRASSPAPTASASITARDAISSCSAPEGRTRAFVLLVVRMNGGAQMDLAYDSHSIVTGVPIAQTAPTKVVAPKLPSFAAQKNGNATTANASAALAAATADGTVQEMIQTKETARADRHLRRPKGASLTSCNAATVLASHKICNATDTWTVRTGRTNGTVRHNPPLVTPISSDVLMELV